jgi:hypothetical protein
LFDSRALQRVAVRKLPVAALALLALGAGGGLALAAAHGVSIPGLGINVSVPPEKAGVLERLVSVATTDSNTEPAAARSLEPHPIPGQILGPDVPVPISPSILEAQNGWLVSDGETLVAVYAGTAGNDPAVGRVVIVRQDLVAGKQTVRAVDAGPTGALSITAAPLGSAVETSAQTGSIGLRTAGGDVLTLDLGSGKVSQDPYGAQVR